MSDTAKITNTPNRIVGAWEDEGKPNWIIIKERTARPKAGPTSKRREWDTDGISITKEELAKIAAKYLDTEMLRGLWAGKSMAEGARQ